MSEKKAKFTAIDAIIILVILAVIVVGAIKILPSFTNGSEKEKVDFYSYDSKQRRGLCKCNHGRR